MSWPVFRCQPVTLPEPDPSQGEFKNRRKGRGRRGRMCLPWAAGYTGRQSAGPFLFCRTDFESACPVAAAILAGTCSAHFVASLCRKLCRTVRFLAIFDKVGRQRSPNAFRGTSPTYATNCSASSKRSRPSCFSHVIKECARCSARMRFAASQNNSKNRLTLTLRDP